MRIKAFIEAAREWNSGGVAVQSRRDYRARLKACEGCRWRSGLVCSLIHCRCRIASYALDRANACPVDRWPLLVTEHRQDASPVDFVPGQ
jgi:hypothetical protein